MYKFLFLNNRIMILIIKYNFNENYGLIISYLVLWTVSAFDNLSNYNDPNGPLGPSS